MLVVGGAALTLATAAFWCNRTQQRLAVNQEFFRFLPRQGRPGGYVSSDQCQACHPSQYASWHRTFHRTMTQYATPASVVGRFDGVNLTRAGQTYHLERRGDGFWVDLPDPEWRPEPGSAEDSLAGAPRVQRRIGLLTGSHHMQAYWVPSRAGNLQITLPFMWLIADRRWVLLQDSILRDPRISRSPQDWNLICLKCHATAGQRALVAWHMGWRPAREASGPRWLAPFLAQLLVDPYATVRYIAHRSLKQLPGFGGFGFDFVGPVADREQARQRVLEIWGRGEAGSPDRTGPAVLIDPNGALQTAALQRWLRQRDDRSMDLQE